MPKHRGPGRFGLAGGLVGAAVVDDEHVEAEIEPLHLANHVANPPGFAEGRDEEDGGVDHEGCDCRYDAQRRRSASRRQGKATGKGRSPARNAATENAWAAVALRAECTGHGIRQTRHAAAFSKPNNMLNRLAICGLLGLVFSACAAGGRDTRVDPNAPDTITGTGLQSQDIKTMVSQMASRLKADGILAPGRDGERASFFITELRNDSSDTIDKKIILLELRGELFNAFGRQIKILDRSPEATDITDAERRMKERGQVSGVNDRKVAGSDFVLKGVISSRDRQADALKSSYILVTFELTDLVSQELVWTGSYSMKTESEKSVINR
ncbi:MAG TPA: hypothetical protein VFZ65_16945 [Planctomycetota bacterium]|nr:hypothetical protein [Planctomycetota bacterium]